MNRKETNSVEKAIEHIKAGAVPSREALKILYGLIGDNDALSEIKKKEDEFKQKEAIRIQECEKRASKGQMKLDRWNNSPEWFKNYFGGITERYGYSIFAETKSWAIVKKQGGTCYLNRASGSKYFPTEYCLVRKSDSNLGHPHQETLFKNRLKKGDEEKLRKALEDAEAGKH